MELNCAPELVEGLVESAAATLQHLQLVVGNNGVARELSEGFWKSVRACSELAALQLVFIPEFEQAMDQQVISLMGTHTNVSLQFLVF